MRRGLTEVSAALLTGLVALPVAAVETVTVDNFIRAETDFYMKQLVGEGCFARLCHQRGAMPVARQQVIRTNLDTPYSAGVFDLTSPVTITMPDPGKRFQSLLVISEDHYIKHVSYGAREVTLTRASVGTRYAYVMIRTFTDPNSAADRQQAALLQDAIRVSQASPGRFEIPDWDQQQRMELRTALLGVGRFLPDSRRGFGDEGEVDPVRRLLATAGGWGGNREADALYLNRRPANQDGVEPHVLTLDKVPVDAFWSVTVYNARGFYEDPISAASVNSVTARAGRDGRTVIHFGGDPKALNYLRIMPGWNYTVRLYRPRADILDGRWTMPDAVPAK